MRDAKAPSGSKVLSGALLGLGMIGTHHARLLQDSSGVRFVGAVDPAGDSRGLIQNEGLVFPSVEILLERERPDFAIVATPTEFHLPAVIELAGAGVNVLVEKPVAASREEGVELMLAVRDAGLRGAVGHVERRNPALIEMRSRVQAGQLGEVFSIRTERVGPFPDRIRDVGVVKDLATHDLDLVRWISGSPIETLSAQTQHKMGREHEDLVIINGKLDNGISFDVVVDWLSPTKVRQTKVLGERGMLVADTLTADLTFYENGIVSCEWGATQSLRGVSEGDMTRYA
ncbi:MAG: Gfo/Idh/MocA family oxidoreductase, partial [Acidobacteria bacterium]|nr:Gfo/Idh/MocA family oxidoreductase [Acidobacteriota bacterium]